MKKILVMSLALLGFAAVGSYAATTQLDFPITVTIKANLIDVFGNTYDASALAFGVCGINSAVNAPGGAYRSNSGLDLNQPYVQVTNNGSATIQLGAYVSNNPTGWTQLLVGNPGAATVANSFRLSAIFTNYFGSLARALLSNPAAGADDWSTVVVGDFEATDVLTATNKLATTTIFARNTDNATRQAATQGHDIPPSPGGAQAYLGQRTMRFCLDTPTTISSGDGVLQTITVRVTAQ